MMGAEKWKSALWSKMKKKTNRIYSYPIIHFPTSEGVSEVSKRADARGGQSAQAKRAARSKRMSERCEPTSERRSEWPSTAVWILDYSGPQWMGAEKWKSGKKGLFPTGKMLPLPFPVRSSFRCP